MAKLDEDTTKKIQELQILEQSLQNLSLQKQAFQLEFNETENALKELKKTKDDVYKLTGQIMLKADKKELEKELMQKKEILRLRTSSLEKQEQEIAKRIEELKKQVTSKLK